MAGSSQEQEPSGTAPAQGGKVRRLFHGLNQASTAGSTWPVLVFALVVLGAGLGTIAAKASQVTAGAVTALVTAVLGVVGTHVGHVAGHELAAKQSTTHPLAAGLEELAQLHRDGKLDAGEFAAAKQKLIG